MSNGSKRPGKGYVRGFLENCLSSFFVSPLLRRTPHLLKSRRRGRRAQSRFFAIKKSEKEVGGGHGEGSLVSQQLSTWNSRNAKISPEIPSGENIRADGWEAFARRAHFFFKSHNFAIIMFHVPMSLFLYGYPAQDQAVISW
jgi:hypothetical protein